MPDPQFEPVVGALDLRGDGGDLLLPSPCVVRARRDRDPALHALSGGDDIEGVEDVVPRGDAVAAERARPHRDGGLGDVGEEAEGLERLLGLPLDFAALGAVGGHLRSSAWARNRPMAP